MCVCVCVSVGNALCVYVVCRWVNRKDPQGRNIFAGGFLGLDNIGM